MSGVFKQFWMVWSENGRAPTYRHYELESAKKEAERLALVDPGTTFFVLEAVECCEKMTVQWSTASDVDEPPF